MEQNQDGREKGILSLLFAWAVHHTRAFLNYRGRHKVYDFQGFDWREFESVIGLRIVFNHHLPGNKELNIEDIYRIAYHDIHGHIPTPSYIRLTMDRRAHDGEPEWVTQYRAKVIKQINDETYEFLNELTRYGVLYA